MTFTRSLLRYVTFLLFATALCSCGGGESSSPAMTTNRAPVANAGLTQTVAIGSPVTLDGSSSNDPDNDAMIFSWSLATPSGSAAALSGSSTARPTFTPDEAGTYTATLTVSDGKIGSSANVTVIASASPSAQAAIALDQIEPLSGTVKLTLTGTVTGAVTWYADLRLLGSGNASDANAITWNTAGVANGDHQILARIQTSDGTTSDVRRTVSVGTSSITLTAGFSTSVGTINVDVRATSSYAITRVAARFDGVDAGVLTEPNACGRICSNGNDIYRFPVGTAQAGSGLHSMVITASDASGSTRTITVEVPVSNAPVLTLTSPSDGALLFGTLRVTGNVTSDKTGTVTTTARLGDVEFMSSTAANFEGNLNLTGISPGKYALTVLSTDSTHQTSQIQRTVVVTSSASLTYSPAFTLPAGGSLLAAAGSQVLYTPGDGSVLIRDIVTSNEVPLGGAASIQYANGWKLDAGRVVAYGKGADCVVYCIYLWSAIGERTNLTNQNPYSRASNISAGWAYDLHPQIHGDWVLWVNDKADATGHYTLHRLSTGEYTKVTSPIGVNYVGNMDFDFALNGNVVDVWFWGQTGGEGTTSQYDIFRWKSDSGTATRITSGGSRNIYTQVDGTRAVWQQSPVGGTADSTFSVVSTNMNSVSPSTLANGAIQLQLRDGVLAWVEKFGNTSKALKVAFGGTTQTLSTASITSAANLLANGGGWVAYAEAGKAYSWNSSTGLSKQRLDVAPATRVYVTGGAMVFTEATSVYRIILD